jgi:hypothetical protein
MSFGIDSLTPIVNTLPHNAKAENGHLKKKTPVNTVNVHSSAHENKNQQQQTAAKFSSLVCSSNSNSHDSNLSKLSTQNTSIERSSHSSSSSNYKCESDAVKRDVSYVDSSMKPEWVKHSRSRFKELTGSDDDDNLNGDMSFGIDSRMIPANTENVHASAAEIENQQQQTAEKSSSLFFSGNADNQTSSSSTFFKLSISFEGDEKLAETKEKYSYGFIFPAKNNPERCVPIDACFETLNACLSGLSSCSKSIVSHSFVLKDEIVKQLSVDTGIKDCDDSLYYAEDKPKVYGVLG